MSVKSLGDIVRNIASRRTPPPPGLSERAVEAIRQGVDLDEKATDALAEQYWRRPYLMAEVLIGRAEWPTPNHSLHDLAKKADLQAIVSDGIERCQLRAAQRTLARMIDLEADLAEREVQNGEH